MQVCKKKKNSGKHCIVRGLQQSIPLSQEQPCSNGKALYTQGKNKCHYTCA